MDIKDLRKRNAKLILLVATAALLSSLLIIETGYAQVRQIVVNLDGSQEVPPTPSTGTGTAHLTVNLATGAITGSVDFAGLSSPTTGGHIHIGVMGMNGPIIVPFVGGLGVRRGTMSLPAGGVMLTPMQLAALRTDGLYVNIHTQAHIGGEIRGQILFTGAM